jgi:hypothetical protein
MPFLVKELPIKEKPDVPLGPSMLRVLGTIWVPNLSLVYAAGSLLGLATGLFVTTNWALGTRLVPSAEAGRYLGISNLAGAGAGMIGTGPGWDILSSSPPTGCYSC